MPDSPVPATDDVDKAEAEYFTEQEVFYSVNVMSGPKSFKNFLIAWNLEKFRGDSSCGVKGKMMCNSSG
jgi:hypothetical protein